MTQRLARARAAADGFFAGVATVPAVDGVDLESLSAFNDAVTEARSVPGNLADLLPMWSHPPRRSPRPSAYCVPKPRRWQQTSKMPGHPSLV